MIRRTSALTRSAGVAKQRSELRSSIADPFRPFGLPLAPDQIQHPAQPPSSDIVPVSGLLRTLPLTEVDEVNPTRACKAESR
jgi:hypothetical protein